MPSPDIPHFGILQEQQQEPPLAEVSPDALVANEWAALPESQEIIRKDRGFILAAPMAVHLRCLIGPSALGKSTIAGQWARVNENDAVFNAQLSARAGKEHQILGVHLSLSQSLEKATSEAGIPKDKAEESHRKIASERMIEAVEVMRNAFTDHDTYTAIVYVDTVGVTTSDLGTNAVTHYVEDPYTRFFAPDSDAKVERKGLELRKTLEALPEGENIDNWLRKKKVHPGISLQGREQTFLNSSGKLAAWERQWRDIYQQMIGSGFMTEHDMKLDKFLSLESIPSEYRLRQYYYWLRDVRLAELGIDADDSDQFAFLQNPYIEDDLHIHFARMYIKPQSGDVRETRHFPLGLLGSDVDHTTIKAEDILDSLGMQK